MKARSVSVLALAFGALASTCCAQQIIQISQMPWDGQNGNASYEIVNAGVPSGRRTADDFFLPSNNAGRWHVTRLRVVMLTLGLIPPAPNGVVFEIYEDTGSGAPAGATPIYTIQATASTLEGTYQSYEVREFSAGDGITALFSHDSGRRLWIAPVLLSPDPMQVAFFCTHVAPPQNGSGGYARDSVPPDSPWVPLGSCGCSAPSDFALAIEASEAPTNDSRETPRPVVDGSVSFDTSGAATESAPITGCGEPGFRSPQNDVWFRYSAPPTLGACNGTFTGAVTMSTCGSAFDTAIAVYDAEAPGDPESPLACNDEHACAGGNHQSELTFTATAARDYLIRIGSADGTTGAGTLSITSASRPPNDDCDLAESVGIGQRSWCTAGATSFGAPVAGCSVFSYPHNEVWYHYTVPSIGRATIRVCGLGARMWVHGNGCPSAADSPLTCGDLIGQGCDPAKTSVEFRGVGAAGREYLIRVGSISGNGDGVLSIFCPADVNFSTSVTVQDLFDFLAEYFGPGQGADFNADNTVSVQDLFDFLGAWFEGCQ